MDALSALIRPCHVWIHAVLFAFAIVFLGPILPGFTDGSRDLIRQGGNRPFLEGGTGKTTAGIDRLNRFFVYARAGETIKLGSSAFGIYQGDILFTSPFGSSSTCSAQRPENAPDHWGRILDIDQELAGPLPAAGGYTPCELSINTGSEGVWEITFLAPHLETYKFSRQLPAGSSWVQDTDVYTIAAWDISVHDAAGQSQTGRVFARHLPLNLGGTGATLATELFILTHDGYEYRVDYNDMRGHTLLLFANANGFIDDAAKPLYRSILLEAVNTINHGLPDGVSVTDPLSMNGQDTAAHKIFFDRPAADLPTEAESPTGPVWLRTVPISTATPSQLTYTGSIGEAGSFSFEASGAGRYIIAIDIDENGIWGDGTDVILSGTASAGRNVAPWDGKDGNGEDASGSKDGYRARLVMTAGAVHLPLFDIEHRTGGLIVERISDTSDAFRLYYDDAVLEERAGGPTPLRNAGGLDSRYGAHAFREGFGDGAGIDTWMQVESEPSFLEVPMFAVQNDLSLALDVDNEAPLRGQAIRVTATLANDGPHDAVLARIGFDIPHDVNVLNGVPEIGSFDTEKRLWTVENLAASDAADIVLNVVPGDEGAHRVFGQIVEHWGNDSDSEPGNFNPILPESNLEDDAAGVTIYTDPEPALGLARRVLNLEGDLSGFDVTYELRVQNLGNTSLSGIQVRDSLLEAFQGTDFIIQQLDAVVPLVANTQFDGTNEINLLDSSASRLGVGEEATVTYTVSVTPSEAFGPFENNAEGHGFGPAGVMASDISDNGTEADPNRNGSAGDPGEDDPTRVTIAHHSVIGLAMEAQNVQGEATDFSATLKLIVENLGDAPLDGVQVELNLAAIFGTNRYDVSDLSASAPLEAQQAFDGGDNDLLLDASSSSLKPGEKATILLDLRGFPAFSFGLYNLRATASAQTIDGNQVTDISDDGSLTDPNDNGSADDSGESDVTVISLEETARIGAALTTSRVSGDFSGFTAVYELKVQNLDDSPLLDVQAVQDLEDVFDGTRFSVSDLSVSPSLQINPDFDGVTDKNLLASGGTLQRNETASISYAVTVTPDSFFGPYRNSVSVSAESENGAITTDISDSGAVVDADQDGNPNEAGENDPTETAFAHNGRLGAALAVNQVSGDMTAFGIAYTVLVENMGDVPLSDLSIIQDLSASLAGVVFEVVDVEAEAPLVASSLFDGDQYKELLDPESGLLEVGESASVTVSLSVIPAENFGPFAFSAEAAGHAPYGTRLTDISTDGVDPDPNQNGDPTEEGENTSTMVTVAERPVLGISLAQSGIDGDLKGFIVHYVARLANLGDVPLDDIQVSLNLAEIFEGADYEVLRNQAFGGLSAAKIFDGREIFNLLDAGVSRLDVNDTTRIELDVRVQPASSLGPFAGNAMASAKSPTGVATADISDDGLVIDANKNGVPNESGENTPTTIRVASKPALGLAKTLNRVSENGNGYEVELAVIARNLGDVPLSELDIIEDIGESFPEAAVEVIRVIVDEASGLSANPSFDGLEDTSVLLTENGRLLPGESATVTLDFRVTPNSGVLEYESRTQARAEDPAGSIVTDWSNDGADPDPNGNGFAADEGEDTPTTIRLAKQPALEFISRLSKLEGDSTRFDIQFSIYLTNAGDTPLDSLQVDADLAGLFSGATIDVTNVEVLNGPSIALNEEYDGRTAVHLLDAAGSSLGLGKTAHLLLDASIAANDFYGPFYGRLKAGARAEDDLLEVDREIPPIRIATSSGFNAGLESNGNLADLLAARIYSRRNIHNPAKTDDLRLLRLMGLESAHGTGGFTSQEAMDLVPSHGPENAEAVVTTPLDLFGVTNATSVLAVDYMKDEKRIAALFSTTTPAGETYEHSKNICDRLQGSYLKDIDLISIQGYPFVLSTLQHPLGDIDYAISFIGYRRGNSYLVDSRFVRDQYQPPTGMPGEVFNFQVWSYSPAYTISLVEDIVDRMAEAGGLDFVSREDDIPKVPSMYVEQGSYQHGSVVLHVKHPEVTSELHISGELSLVESGDRIPFETVVPAPMENALNVAAQVAVPSGNLYDALLNVTDANGEHLDQIYLADGAWGQVVEAHEANEVESFTVLEQSPYAPNEDHYIVERGIHFSGVVASKAVVFRHLKPAGRAVDLSGYEYFSFEASGKGKVRVRLEEAGDASDHFFIDLDLDEDLERYIVFYDEFAKDSGEAVFQGNAVTALSFVFEAGDEPEEVELLVQGVLFGKGSPVGVEDEAGIPIEYSLSQNYPNPFNPVTTIEFGLPEPADVRLEVFDILGRRVVTIADQEYAPGKYSLPFDAGRLASGSYVYRLIANDRVFSKVMHLLK